MILISKVDIPTIPSEGQSYQQGRGIERQGVHEMAFTAEAINATASKGLVQEVLQGE